MPDREPREIIVPVSVRYGVWPGHERMCVQALTEDGEIGMWLHSPEGEVSQLVPFRYGMFRRVRG